MTADAAPAADVAPKAKVFISYSRKDMAFADRLEAGLKARGFEPLIDRAEIYAFEDWWKRIQALIRRGVCALARRRGLGRRLEGSCLRCVAQ
jgi:hypothetical protein